MFCILYYTGIPFEIQQCYIKAFKILVLCFFETMKR